MIPYFLPVILCSKIPISFFFFFLSKIMCKRSSAAFSLIFRASLIVSLPSPQYQGNQVMNTHDSWNDIFNKMWDYIFGNRQFQNSWRQKWRESGTTSIHADPSPSLWCLQFMFTSKKIFLTNHSVSTMKSQLTTPFWVQFKREKKNVHLLSCF